MARPAGAVAWAILLAGCTAGVPQAPASIAVAPEHYAVAFTDSLESAGGIEVVDATGMVLKGEPLTAQDLQTRTTGGPGTALLGARSKDMVFVWPDGTLTTATLGYDDGTGVTASAWVDDETLISMVNVGQLEQGYSNPVVFHDAAGDVKASLDYTGYIASIMVVPDLVVLAGESLDGDPMVDEDGSRVTLMGLESRSVVREYRWDDAAGLEGCGVQGSQLRCFEQPAVGDGTGNPDVRDVVTIDLESGDKQVIGSTDTLGLEIVEVAGQWLVFSTVGVQTWEQLEAGSPLRPLVGSGDEEVERVVVTGEFLDVFVRDLRRLPVEGGVQVGSILRLEPRSLEVIHQAPVVVPDQEAVQVHVFPGAYFDQ